jgi:hypothetical protein
MAYIRLSDNYYPISEQEIRLANPNTSFATPFNPDGYAWVFSTPQPATTRLQIAREIAPVFDPIKLTWGQAWEVVDLSLSPEELAALLVVVKAEKCSALDALYESKLYTNTTALFPSGERIIQLRDDKDFKAFERTVLAAITRQAARRESATVEFRPEDNTTQVVPASEFIPIALDILDAKDALWKIRSVHKDVINNDLATVPQVLAYDISTDWPETNEPVWVMEERASKIYKAMIRRRAAVLSDKGQAVEALALLKTIGE